MAALDISSHRVYVFRDSAFPGQVLPFKSTYFHGNKSNAADYDRRKVVEGEPCLSCLSHLNNNENSSKGTIFFIFQYFPIYQFFLLFLEILLGGEGFPSFQKLQPPLILILSPFYLPRGRRWDWRENLKYLLSHDKKISIKLF